MREISKDEKALLTHISMWGSDGYPVQQISGGWAWGPWRSIKGSPLIFPSKKLITATKKS